MGLLKMIGLMTVAEHEAAAKKDAPIIAGLKFKRDQALIERDGWYANFKRAATDLAAQAEEIAGQSVRIAELNAEIMALTPDAQSWRNRQERERQRGERRKGMG